MDHLNGRPSFEIIERDDGTVIPSGGPQMYFAPFRRWDAHTRRANWTLSQTIDSDSPSYAAVIEKKR